MLRVSVVVGGMDGATWPLQPWRYLWEVASELAELGHEVEVLSERASTVVPRAAGLRCVDVPSVRTAGRGGIGPHLRDNRPDVVMWNVGATSALSLRPPRLPGTRNVAVFTSPLYRPLELIRIGGVILRDPISNAAHVVGSLISTTRIARYLGTNYDRVIFPGRSAGEALLRAGLSANVADIVPPGRDRDLQPAPPKRGGSSGAITFLYPGSPAPIRGVDVLLRAFAAIDPAASHAMLVILSRHERSDLVRQTNHLRRQARRLGLDGHVDIVAGMLPRQEMLSQFARADAVVLPFRLVPSEAPLAVLEAAGAGKPLIASAYPAIADLAAPGSLLVRPGDVAALAHAITRLAADPAEREMMASSASRWYAAWPTWSEVGRRIEESILEGQGPQMQPRPGAASATPLSPSSVSLDGLQR